MSNINISSVLIYSDYPSSSLNINRICDGLKKFGVKAEYLGNFFNYLNLSEHDAKNVARELSSGYITDIEKENLYLPQDKKRIDDELEILKGHKSTDHKLLYDGRLLNSIYFSHLIRKDPDAVIKNDIHIVFTSRLLCTFGDKRYHARVILLGVPAIISTSGVVEAPAKPREYYWLKASFIQNGKDLEELNDMFSGRFVDYDDPNLTEILYSYTLQAIFYNITGEPFCPDKDCCLYNSHWQEEVLTAQLSGNLCNRHLNIIKSLNQT